MLRGFALVALLAVFLAVVLVPWSGGDETAPQPEAKEESYLVSPEEDVAPQATQGNPAEETVESTGPPGETALENQRCQGREGEEREIRVGDFAPPEEGSVPPHEVIEETPVDRDGVKAARLLVDTRARDEDEYTLIARKIKAEYEYHDAVTIEFTDTTGTLSYNGSALIFNTPRGACYMGYAYGPPNNEGYRVTAAG